MSEKLVNLFTCPALRINVFLHPTYTPNRIAIRLYKSVYLTGFPLREGERPWCLRHSFPEFGSSVNHSQGRQIQEGIYWYL